MSLPLQVSNPAIPLPLNNDSLSLPALADVLELKTAPASSASVRKMDWPSSLPFFIFHAFVFVTMFTVDYSWKWAGVAVASYYLRMFAITAGYHRYFSHRTYTMGRIPRFLMGFLGAAATQKGPLWWASHHRHHHRFSDKKEDIHSPVQEGFWYSHMGWILSREHHPTRWELIKDLSRFPELVWINKYHLVAPVVYGAVCLALGGWNGLIWGYFFSTVLLWHGVFSINSLSHVWGKRVYQTDDDSRNNLWLALITLGEGWHNNHHCYKASANQGFHWWQIDISYYVIKAASWVGITRDIRKAPLKQLEAKKLA